MSAKYEYLTQTQARRHARTLSEWGYTGIEIIESFDTCEFRVVAENRCGMRRVVRSLADFLELKELEAAR